MSECQVSQEQQLPLRSPREPALCAACAVQGQLGLSRGSNPPALSPSGRELFIVREHFVRAGLQEFTPLENSVSLGNHP